ncbi:transposase [Streptomyces sp. BBFR109]|uniref:transposase n=1 Tax=Streptomyces sp. BBFR109 TaxID=3448172 RepID=UPI003F77306D
MDAILYVDRTGVQWRYLPHDFPHWNTVYGYFAKWADGGVFAQLLAGECVVPIGPMPQPDAASDETNNDTLKLFAARARAARPSFELCEDNRSEVLALFRRLDGIPLAIELAAARLRTMPLELILRRLDNRFQTLAGARSAQSRHQTLRAAIAWSHDLCDPAEQELWARLSVFAGGFPLSAVEDICRGGILEGLDVVEMLGSLVDKSVVQYMDGPAGPRYRMLDTIREFGAAALEGTGHSETYARRHQEFFLRMAEQARQEWFGDPADGVERAARHQPGQLSSRHGVRDHTPGRRGRAADGQRPRGALAEQEPPH